MKKLAVVFLIIFINVLVTLGLIYCFVWSKLIYIEANSNIHQDLLLTKGSIIISEGSSVTGKIDLAEGKIILKEKTNIQGDIHLQSGNIDIQKGAIIQGNLTIDQGNLTLAENVEIKGHIQLGQGQMEKHSTASILGTKPALFITSDWPTALAYFDALPEKHKQAVGYIFLTKGDNTSIRNANVLKASDYFEGIYYYQDKKLLSIDLKNDLKTKPFFDQAGSFFKSLPERRLGPFSVGATTKISAINPKKADIYVPTNGSQYTFIHEMGHVLDFQNDFSDFYKPKYPFISQQIALNSYAATHPGEDFAEAYKYYVTNPQYFLELIKAVPERQQKYDYLKKYLFENKEYFS